MYSLGKVSQAYKNKPLLAIAIVVLCVLGGGAAVFTYNRHIANRNAGSTYNAASAKGGASANSQKGESQPTEHSPQYDSSNHKQPGDTKAVPGDTNTTSLVKPSGNFVSNHRPNLDGNPAPNTLSSVCTTTPGASCTITFTKDGTTKSLPAQTTDRAGSSYWNDWSLQSIGLTEGSWQIQAVATLNGQHMSASDALKLEVAP